MRCEACLPLVDEFFDGELDSRLVGDVRAHLTGCTSCSGYYESLRLGQGVYDRFFEDVKVGTTVWQGVRHRIRKNEVAGKSRLLPGFFENLHRLAIPRFQWAVVTAALGVIVLGIVLMRVGTRVEDKQQVATADPPRVAPQLSPEQPRLENQASSVTKAHETIRHSEKSMKAKAPVRNVVTSQTVAMFEKAAAFQKAMESARLELDANRPVTLETDVARHFEKTRLLLMALKNTPVPETGAPVNFSYEKTLSRKIANSNLLLRRETATAGDRSTAELLDQIEPLLIEIANMPDHASAAEVASISRRIARRNVIGLLQSQTF